MIRRATSEDISWMLPLLKEFLARAGATKSIEPDEESMRATLEGFLDSEDGAIFVSEKDGKLGCAGVWACQCYFNHNERVAQELFIRSENGTLFELVDAMEKWVRESGIKMFSLMNMDGQRSKALDRIYKSRGYFPMENHYAKVF